MVELDQLPLYELHTMYYQWWRDRDAEAKLTEEERSNAAVGKVIEDII